MDEDEYDELMQEVQQSWNSALRRLRRAMYTYNMRVNSSYYTPETKSQAEADLVCAAENFVKAAYGDD